MLTPRRKWWVILGFSALLVAALCLCQSVPESRPENAESLFPQLSALVRTLETIDTYYVEEVNIGKLLREGAKRLVSGLDPRSTLQFSGEGFVAGADVGLNLMPSGGSFIVISTEPGSPSEAAGVVPGWSLVGLGGEAVGEMSLEELCKRLRGEPGTEVSLTFLEPGDLTTRTLNIERKRYSCRAAEFSIGQDGILRFRVHRFASGVSETFKEAIVRCRGSRLRGILIDLRDNIGGSIAEVRQVCSRFVVSGPLFLLSGKWGLRKVYREDSVSPMRGTLPVAVLINGRTVGEAEVMAACLRGHRIARLVGERTFGFALSTECITTSDGSKLILSTAEYEGPFGRKIHRVGVEPDIAAKSGPKSDQQMQEALRALHEWRPFETK